MIVKGYRRLLFLHLFFMLSDGRPVKLVGCHEGRAKTGYDSDDIDPGSCSGLADDPPAKEHADQNRRNQAQSQLGQKCQIFKHFHTVLIHNFHRLLSDARIDPIVYYHIFLIDVI